MHFKEYKSILSPKNGMNIYRGCTHGCIYCDSRSHCYQFTHSFTDIEVKKAAPLMLEQALKNKRKKVMIGTGSMTDSYIPLEKELGYTRKCLEIIDRYGFGLAIQTKSSLILRDLDLLKSINRKAKCVVQITLTTYDESLCKVLEPYVSTTKERFEVLKILRDNGIPTIVWLDPLLPFINDTRENLIGILNYCIEARVYGILMFGIGLTLREGSREYFYEQLDKQFPGLKEKYQRKFGNQYEVMSDNNRELSQLFYDICLKHGIITGNDRLFEYMHTFEEKEECAQLSLPLQMDYD